MTARKHVHIDIETCPTQDPDAIAEIRKEIDEKRNAMVESAEQEAASVKAPGNWKDPEKIKSFIREKTINIQNKLASDVAELDQVFEEKYHKTGLDGGLGEICVISWAIDEDPKTYHVFQDPTGQAADHDERGMLQEFFYRLPETLGTKPGQFEPICWVGHNILGFDLRFIYQRCVIHGHRPSVDLCHLAPPHSDSVFDTMLEWAGYRGKIKEERLCQALKLDGKGVELAGTEAEDIDGSQVWDYVKAGKLEHVVTYCDGDVTRAQNIWKKLTFRGA